MARAAKTTRGEASMDVICRVCHAHLRPEFNYCPHCGSPTDPSGDRPLYVVEGLTNLFNVVFFESLLETEISRATRYGHTLSVLVAEIDDLAELEAGYGYDETSSLVRQIGELIATAIRDPDTLAATNRVAALGTQRFLVLLPETSEEGAFRAAEKIRTLIAGTPVAGPEGPLALSVSVGVASTGNTEDNANLMGRATQALFIARAAGPGRIQVSAAL
ncbi:MAG TPA: diguanylate cyclase [Candidatus Dormibacteraeota bacterium]|nr:diguanylate cyclase [Candidatus Dormibacteraeota bacterium]